MARLARMAGSARLPVSAGPADPAARGPRHGAHRRPSAWRCRRAAAGAAPRPVDRRDRRGRRDEGLRRADGARRSVARRRRAVRQQRRRAAGGRAGRARCHRVDAGTRAHPLSRPSDGDGGGGPGVRDRRAIGLATFRHLAACWRRTDRRSARAPAGRGRPARGRPAGRRRSAGGPYGSPGGRARRRARARCRPRRRAEQRSSASSTSWPASSADRSVGFVSQASCSIHLPSSPPPLRSGARPPAQPAQPFTPARRGTPGSRERPPRSRRQRSRR